jgi:hypothetical protein
MAKKNDNAIYAPGELDRVRGKLGKIDNVEANRVANILGGEVGTERNAEPEPYRGKNTRHETVEVVVNGRGGSRKPGRRVDLANLDDEEELLGISRAKAVISYPGDDPAVPARLGYFDRVKIDQLCGQMVFEIKSSFQILVSIFSFFKEPTDYVNSRFVTGRMNEYYHKIEVVVTSTRNLLPLNNNRRNNQLKRASIFVYKVIDILRTWNIEKIAGNIAELQSHPRDVRVTDYAEILRNIYRPLFILEELNTENIKSAFKLVYKILYIESPMDAKEKYQDTIRNIIGAFMDIRREVQFCLYPLLMKLISDRFFQYERFFVERQRRYQAFLNVNPQEQLNASDFSQQQIEGLDVETLKEDISKEPSESDQAEADDNKDKPEEDLNDPQVIARKAQEDAEKAESKALEQGKTALEMLFPKAGWDKLEEFPDLYPYFSSEYHLRRGYELIAPSDPVQQVAIIMHILEDIFYGMRYVRFGTVSGSDGRPVNINDEISETIGNWRAYIDDSFVKEYLPRLTEYCRMLENSEESRISVYAKKIINELHWIKRLCFLPYYRFESLGPPPFQKQDVSPIYKQIRSLRRHLTTVAQGIEQGTHAGGAAAKIPCNGINNPWEPYNFEVPNPFSRRLNMMLPQERRNNASLIFFSLAAVTVLDFIVNNENSWAYSSRPGPLFRSVKNVGVTPLFGVDEKIDTEKLFKDSLKK